MRPICPKWRQRRGVRPGSRMNVNIRVADDDPRENSRKRSENVAAVLGPTNTGKTHYAIERMLAHPAGMIGLPLRLLAREVYNRVVEKVGAGAVALITGEEKIKPQTTALLDFDGRGHAARSRRGLCRHR